MPYDRTKAACRGDNMELVTCAHLFLHIFPTTPPNMALSGTPEVVPFHFQSMQQKDIPRLEQPLRRQRAKSRSWQGSTAAERT